MRSSHTAVLAKLKSTIPWWGKIIAKLVMARAPITYGAWSDVGLFRYGTMEQPAYAYHTFVKHFECVPLAQKAQGFVCLELGPGDSLFSAVIAHAFGAARTYCLDCGRYAAHDLERYRAMLRWLRERNRPLPELESCSSLDELLDACNAHYETDGLRSLRAVPNSTVDFIWSNAVLEHVRRAEFLDMLRELRRVIRPEGVSSHRVDLRDHLGGGLNNLRFSEPLWEWEFMAKSGFYTNRIRYSEMVAMFEQAGFAVTVTAVERWDRLPTPKHKMSDGFRSLPDDELCVYAFDVILTPKA